MGVLKSLEVSDASFFENKAIINIMYHIPNSEHNAYHSLIIDDSGNESVINEFSKNS